MTESLTRFVLLSLDKGLITFECGGKIIVSSTLADKTVECLGLGTALKRSVGAFSKAQEAYSTYPSGSVFFPDSSRKI